MNQDVEEKNSNYVGEKMEYKLSPSSLNLLEDCPRCFWLYLNKKIKRPPGLMPGIVMKIEAVVKSYFNHYRELGELPPIIAQQVKGTLAKDMPKTLYHTEDNGIKLWGRPDDYLKLSSGDIVPFDHKTKANEPEPIPHPAYQLQMDVYSYLLQMNDFNKTNKAYLAFYYPDDEYELHDGMNINCKVIEVETNPARAKKLAEKAYKILNGPMPESGKNCEYCKWRDETSGI